MTVRITYDSCGQQAMPAVKLYTSLVLSEHEIPKLKLALLVPRVRSVRMVTSVLLWLLDKTMIDTGEAVGAASMRVSQAQEEISVTLRVLIYPFTSPPELLVPT